VNKRYLQHFKRGHFDLMLPPEFYEKMNKIEVRPHLQFVLKYYFLLQYWTGRRPSQVLEFQRKDFRQIYRQGVRFLEINCEPKKGENPITLYLVFDNIPLLNEFWEWLETHPPNFWPFYLLHHRGKRHFVKWKSKENGEIVVKTKGYPNIAANVIYWSNKLQKIGLDLKA